MSGSQLEHGKKVGGMLFVARGKPPEVLDAIEDPLDAVARAIQHRAEAGFATAMDHWRDVGRGPGGFDLPAQPVSIVGLDGQYDRVLAQVPEPTRGNRAL